ncbi:MAG TPA: vWA domain-containing protein [Candidatus Polarisedimenticolaceae bacterium]|nr:vWA domain-containing protein [Candidatus Polarisedimenticolaceae bacterium]
MLAALPLLAAALIQGPPADDLLYGASEASVRGVPGAERIDLFLDAYPVPFCRLPGSGGACPFEAGTAFESRRLRAVALDARGRTLEEETVVTRGFPAPVRVTARSLLVPVVAEPPLAAGDLDCRLGKEPCRVVELLPAGAAGAAEVSIALLVDVSGSMHADRAELRDLLGKLVGWLPSKAAVSLSRFAEDYEEVVPLTRDAAALGAGVDALEEGVSTCIWAALGQGLDALATKPGLRVLVLITDGVETCASSSSAMPPAFGIDAVRRAGARLYVFRSGQFAQGRSLEALALDSGGRVFGRGGFVGLERALAALAEDVRHTFLADVAPGPGYRDGERLTLKHRGGKSILVPAYVPASAEQRNLMVLAHGDAEARREAAAALADAPTRTVLRGLLDTLEETEDAALLEAFGRAAAALLLHGEGRDQEAALDAAERATRRKQPLSAILLAALRVYPRTGPPEGRARRAVSLVQRQLPAELPKNRHS